VVDPITRELAQENLQYIRKTLDAAGRFTAVPGKGLMAAGAAALGGVALNCFVTGAPWGEGPFCTCSRCGSGGAFFQFRSRSSPTESTASPG